VALTLNHTQSPQSVRELSANGRYPDPAVRISPDKFYKGIPRLPTRSLHSTSQGRGAGEPDQTVAGHSQNLMDLYAAQLRLIVANGAKALAWDLNWANWAINRGCQFAHISSRKLILGQALEMVAGVRFELTTFGL
jgi:hypothetical protein